MENTSGNTFLQGTLRGRPRALLRGLLLGIAKPLLRLTILGLEHVPQSGPVLVVSNHLHNVDPIFLEMAMPRPLHFMAKKELFQVPLLGWAVRRVGAFPVDRGRADRAALRRAEALLASGIAVGMYPEGTRSETGALQPAFPGAGLVALRTGAPVLPVAIYGTERLPGNGKKAQPQASRRASDPSLATVTIRFGQTIEIPRSVAGTKTAAAEAAELMMREIARLLPPRYHGIYSTTMLNSSVIDNGESQLFNSETAVAP